MGRPTRFALVLALTAGFMSDLRPIARAQVVPRVPLELKDVTEVPTVGNGAILGQAKCDVSGNLYVRMYQQGVPHMAVPVLKISRDGKSVIRFEISSATGFEREGVASDFAVSLRGEVYFVAGRLDQTTDQAPRILAFRENGAYDTTVEVGSLHGASQVAAFSSGELLISGTLRQAKGQDSSENPVTAVFDRGGKLIARVEVPRGAGAEDQTTSKPDQESQLLYLEQAVPGDDGNVYLLRPQSLFRPGAPSPIWVISPAGQILRTITATAPAGGFKALSLKEAGGRVVVQFLQTTKSGQWSEHVLSVFDAESGERLVVYDVPIKVGGLLACYSPNGFTFIGNSGQHLTIEFAPLK